jgi:antitoxin ParD1/3/4
MNVSITPELEQFVARTVASGRYGSASEVVRAALRLFEESERRKEQRAGAGKASGDHAG